MKRETKFSFASLIKGLNALLWFFLSFSAITLLTSSLTGTWFIQPTFSVLVGLIGAYCVFRWFPIALEIPPIAWGFFLLLLGLLVVPVLLTHGVAASADAVTTTAMRIMQTRIPPTYAPYSNISFSYQIGFPLLANALWAHLRFIPDYQFAWMLGAIFGALFVPLLYLFSRTFHLSENIALVSIVLLFGSKLVFENFYWGEFAWLSATVFAMAALIAWKKNNPVVFLFVPAVVTLHPAIAFNLLIWTAVFLALRQLDKKMILGSVLSVLAAIPALYYNYTPIVSNLLSGHGEGPFRIASGIQNLGILPFWIGTGLTLCFVISLLLWYLNRSKSAPVPRWPMVLLGVSLLGFFFLSTMGTILANREIELVLFGVLFWTATNFASTEVFERFKWPFLAALLLVGLLSFAFSSSLASQRNGSKISSDEIELANTFKSIDSTRAFTIFLSRGGGKMVEIADKIPFDANSSLLVSTAAVLVIRNKGFDEFKQRHEVQEAIIANRCVQCVLELPVDYAVVDTAYAGFDLPLAPIASSGSVHLYRLH